jgi:UBX domain
LKELRLHKDRRRGYEGSVQSDLERQERERREQIEAMEREKAALERQKATLERRQALQESLPEEPPLSTPPSEVMTVALRFPDGKSAQRRFAPDAKLASVFNWVDATFGIERELVTLTTLNGQKRYEWDEDDNVEMTLTEAGFGKMTGLRVTEQKPDAAAAASSP